MTRRAMASLASLAFVAFAGCGGGSGGSAPQTAPIATLSIANGTLTAPASNGAQLTLNFTGTVPPDETATVTTGVAPEVLTLELGHTVGSGATVTFGPQPVSVLLDRCSGGFAGGPEIALSGNPNINFYDTSVSPPAKVATVAPITPHQVVICAEPRTVPTQTLMPGRRYAIVIEV